MDLLDIVRRDPRPQPWAEVSKIPWDDPAFSARMLREHLSQDHDAASRRASTIDRQVDWIHTEILEGQPAQVLDLGCGPGLYCNRLARLGHHCTGIDFGPASIEHAQRTARSEGLDCEFILGDLRATDYGVERDLILLLYGELNTFQRGDAVEFLRRAHDALSPTGNAVLEVHTLESIRERGGAPPSWSARERGLFSERPYIRLDDACWHEDQLAAVERHFVIDAQTGEVTRYGTTTRAYTREGYEELLREAGFGAIAWRDTWPAAGPGGEFELVVASKRGS